jgi:hypothetical protein
MEAAQPLCTSATIHKVTCNKFQNSGIFSKVSASHSERDWSVARIIWMTFLVILLSVSDNNNGSQNQQTNVQKLLIMFLQIPYHRRYIVWVTANVVKLKRPVFFRTSPARSGTVLSYKKLVPPLQLFFMTTFSSDLLKGNWSAWRIISGETRSTSRRESRVTASQFIS